MKSAALEAAGSSSRGSGWAPSGPASAWECRAAQSRQARPEEAQEPSWGAARGGGTLTMLRHRRAAAEGEVVVLGKDTGVGVAPLQVSGTG